MSVLISLILFSFVIVFTPYFLNKDITYLINIPSAMIVFPVTYFFAIGIVTAKQGNLALKSVFHLERLNQTQLENSKVFFKLCGDLSIAIGMIGVFIGLVAMAHYVWDEPKAFGSALAVCILTILYGLWAKLPFYVLEQKCEFLLESIASTQTKTEHF